jgi:hypothetical protein
MQSSPYLSFRRPPFSFIIVKNCVPVFGGDTRLATVFRPRAVSPFRILSPPVMARSPDRAFTLDGKVSRPPAT